MRKDGIILNARNRDSDQTAGQISSLGISILKSGPSGVGLDWTLHPSRESGRICRQPHSPLP
jgi:hypothetical protein